MPTISMANIAAEFNDCKKKAAQCPGKICLRSAVNAVWAKDFSGLPGNNNFKVMYAGAQKLGYKEVHTSIRLENMVGDVLAKMADHEGCTNEALICKFHDKIL